MTINHIAMFVTNLEESKSFYEKYFGAKCGEFYHNTKSGLMTYFLSFEDGARLEIMTRPEYTEKCGCQYEIGLNHFAFSVGSRSAVDALTNRLANDGYTVIGNPRVTGDGYYESVVLDNDGNRIEITE